MMKISDLNKTYGRRGNANRVLRDVSLTLPDTGFVCILGPSGCGKTSLLNAIGGLDRFDSGTLELYGLKVTGYGSRAYEEGRNHSFGYIFQNYYLLQNHTVAYNVYLGLHSLDLSHREKLRRVREALAAVDMERFLRRRVDTLSGGQQQRVAIARALSRRPRIIFADEPTGNLDEANTVNICTLLRKISKTNLVVMVTHEERIARFFADRIIRLDGGAVVSDSSMWNRDGLSAEEDGTLYTGDYAGQTVAGDGVHLRLLREDGAEPVCLTVVALKDRIVIKLEDGRAVSCGTAGESPALLEGDRPVMTLETVEQDADLPEFGWEDTPSVRAGRGLRLPMMLAEARSLHKGRGIRSLGTWFFMVLLTVMSLLILGDYLTVSAVDPHDFVRTDSHILEIRAERGSSLDANTLTLTGMIGAYTEHYETSGQEFTILPHVSPVPEIRAEIYLQLEKQTLELSRYSYVPLDALQEDTLILGRMPETPTEVVVDRWVLDSILQEDGILQNSISDISYFLDRTLTFPKKAYNARIVGICDSGEAAMYMARSAIVSIGVNGTGLMTLSEFRQMFPGEYQDVTLSREECLYIQGENDTRRSPGQIVTLKQSHNLVITRVVEMESYAAVVVADDAMDAIVRDMLTQRFYLYCADKAAMKAFLNQPMPEALEDMLQIKVIDAYTDSWHAYENASHMKADARTIVTATVAVLALVMLYLLRRSQVHQRIEMLAVYRLLGIPKRKLTLIFAMESCLCFLTSALPAGILTWLTVTVLSGMEDVAFSMVLPPAHAAAAALAILLYHLLVSLLTLHHLLLLPPAQLAAKYDF